LVTEFRADVATYDMCCSYMQVTIDTQSPVVNSYKVNKGKLELTRYVTEPGS